MSNLASEAVPLGYQERPPRRWWANNWLHRILILVAALWLSWYLIGWFTLVVRRYNCYRLEQQALQFSASPPLATISYSPPGPAISSVPAATSAFLKSVWTARSVNPWTFTSPMLSATPVFCHELTTPKGIARLVQIYANVTPGMKAPTTDFTLMALTFPIHDRNWILRGDQTSTINGRFLPALATITVHFRSVQGLTMTGGRLDPSDASTVTFTYTLNQQPRSFRIHLFDEAKSGMPRMAMESLLTDWAHLPGCAGYSAMNFFDWPVAGSSTAK